MNKGKGTAGMVCGILSIVFCWFPYLGLPLGIVAIVMGALQNKAEGEGGTAGITMGIIGSAISLIWLIIALLIVAAVGSMASVF